MALYFDWNIGLPQRHSVLALKFDWIIGDSIAMVNFWPLWPQNDFEGEV